MKYNINLDEEIIDGHKVSAETKKLWQAQLDILDKFQQVCEKHNLKYFASGGTLLGAVRHKGYIPWDDDIDIHMLAADYEKFCKIAEEELKPYFWQEWRTEPGYKPLHGKIRNGNTTGCTEYELNNWYDNMNKGIFIDIFPIYYIPKSKLIHELQCRLVLFIRRLISYYDDDTTRKLQAKKQGKSYKSGKKFKMIKFFASRKNLNSIFSWVCNWQKKPTDYVGATSFDCREKRFIWRSEIYRDNVDLPFMGGYIKGPIDWDGWLKQQFGDYNVIVKGGSMHSGLIVDVDVPYKEKLKNLK